MTNAEVKINGSKATPPLIDRNTRFGWDVILMVGAILFAYTRINSRLDRIEDLSADRYSLSRSSEVRLREQLANPEAVVIDPRSMEPFPKPGDR
ncbi:MAG: hypothetical protein AAFP26_01050 [Planctomycetota bacterium]